MKIIDTLLSPIRGRPPIVSVVRLDGIIKGSDRFSRSLNLASVAGRLEAAFKMRHSKAVALVVNSPGGSPVQSDLIAGRIRDLAKEHEKPVVAFVEDVAASGGYLLALAADEIFVNPASIIGSIGVISAGFGFQDAIERIGLNGGSILPAAASRCWIRSRPRARKTSPISKTSSRRSMAGSGNGSRNGAAAN